MKKTLYKILYVQVLAAIVIGVLSGRTYIIFNKTSLTH